MDGYASLLERFVQRNESISIESILSSEDEDAEILVRVGASDRDTVRVHPGIVMISAAASSVQLKT